MSERWAHFNMTATELVFETLAPLVRILTSRKRLHIISSGGTVSFSRQRQEKIPVKEIGGIELL
jgi:hypothetical protein